MWSNSEEKVEDSENASNYTNMSEDAAPEQARDDSFEDDPPVTVNPRRAISPGIGMRYEASKRVVLDVEQTLLQRIQQELNSDNASAASSPSAARPVVESEDGVELVQTKSSLDRFLRKRFPQDAVNSATMTGYIQAMINEEFPADIDQIPTAADLINIGKIQKNRSLYSPGDWVEIEGNDMKWRLDMITRVIKAAPDSYDWTDPANDGKEPEWTFTYNAGAERNVDAWDLRTPESGLKILFGCRPWVWQQWALLKVEAKLRFQKGHQDDFMELDIQKYAADLWEKWLEHPANDDFRKVYYDKRIGEKGRLLLTNHIQKPFHLIDVMGEEDKHWNFKDDDNINVFTYLGLFGSGISLPTLVLAVQIAIPIILVVEVNRKNYCYSGDAFEDNDYILSRTMIIAVFTYYLFSIFPGTYATFFNVAGAADTVYSRLLSLRRELWLQGDDTALQMIGYKLDINMNTSYETFLSMLNIYVLLNTGEAIEIVLNALAFTFIARIDEDIINSDWYDPERRWVTAAAQTVCIQQNLRLKRLQSTKLFSQCYDINEDDLKMVCEGDRDFLRNKGLAKLDQIDRTYMSNNEKIVHMCAKVAREEKNMTALDEYKKPVVYFGFFERVFKFLNLTYPVFERHTEYRTWSRWERVLFMSPVPDLDTIFTVDSESGKICVSAHFDNIGPPFENFYPTENHTSSWELFTRHFWDVILFKDLFRAAESARGAGIFSFIFRLFDGICTWFGYLIHILFPLYLFAGFYEVFYNLTYGICLNPIGELFSYANSWIQSW